VLTTRNSWEAFRFLLRAAFLELEQGRDVNVALSPAKKVKQKMPRSSLAADTVGWAYYRLGSFEPAVAQLQESVRGGSGQRDVSIPFGYGIPG